MTKRKREKDSLCMYVDDEAFYRLIFACCLFCCIMSHTLNGHNFFPSMQQQWVCVALLALLTVTVTLADGGNQRNKVTEHFIFCVTLTALYCHILLYFTLHCYVYITTDLSVLPCATLYYPICYYILPYQPTLLYITSQCTILSHTIYIQYHHTCLYSFLNISVSPQIYLNFPFLVYSILSPCALYLPHTALFHSFSSILPHTAL